MALSHGYKTEQATTEWAQECDDSTTSTELWGYLEMSLAVSSTWITAGRPYLDYVPLSSLYLLPLLTSVWTTPEHSLAK